MIDAPVVWRYIVIVKKESFLHYNVVSYWKVRISCFLHLLKLVTGVDISTRPVNKSGSPGNEVKSSIRTAAAAPNTAAFLLSILILKANESNR